MKATLHRWVLTTTLAAALTACSGGGGESGSSNTVGAPEITATGTAAATLSWTTPTQNVDNSPLADLAGYRIYYGTNAGSLSQTATVSDPGATSYVIGNLAPGTYYFAIAAYTAIGAESDRSAVVSAAIP